jgi:hypothetical protein
MLSAASRTTPKVNVVAAVTIVVLVIVALTAQNLRLRGPELVQEESGGILWEGKITRRGWPWAYLERTASYPVASQYALTGGPWHYEKFSSPTGSWNDLRTLAIAGDLAVALLIIVATAIVMRFWQSSRTRAIQFGIRTLLMVTALVAIALAMIEGRILSWIFFLYLPIGLGIACLPTAVGIVLYQRSRRLKGRTARV